MATQELDVEAAAWRPGEGARVRVHARIGGRSCEENPHFAGEAGRTGRVVRGDPTSFAPRHPCLVMFDEPCAIDTVYSGRLWITARHYAADELEPIEP